MAHLIFYEKPGCGGNAAQRSMLQAAGHSLDRRDLSTHAWSRDELLAFFGSLPVTQWFNRSAPRVKSGEVQPELLSKEAALGLLLSEPLLIRRPLMQREDGERLVGFDGPEVEGFVGLSASDPRMTRSMEGCAAARGEHAAAACHSNTPEAE